jgi:hypothetical protein
MLIGLALMLCISPVAAVSADDFEVVITKSDEKNIFTGSSKLSTYTYSNVNNQSEEYFWVNTTGTKNMFSYVTFKPANIPDAPEMVVETKNGSKDIYLPQSVDVWDIKYYSHSSPMSSPSHKYLKNAGVVNLNEYFKGEFRNYLYLELSLGQFIQGDFSTIFDKRWSIPEVKK